MLIGGAFILLLSSPFLGVFVAEIFGMLTSVIGLTALFSIGLSHLPFLEPFGFGVSFPYMAVILAVLFILSGIGAWFNNRPAKRTYFGIAAKFSLLQSLIFLITFLFIAYVDGQQIIGEATVEPGSFLVITNFLVILDQFQRMGFLFFFVILASLINLWIIRKSIIEPIEQLAAVAKEIAEKKYRKVLPIPVITRKSAICIAPFRQWPTRFSKNSRNWSTSIDKGGFHQRRFQPITGSLKNNQAEHRRFAGKPRGVERSSQKYPRHRRNKRENFQFNPGHREYFRDGRRPGRHSSPAG